MLQILEPSTTNFEAIPVDEFWNTDTQKELKLHRIHAYPAKFPAFIPTKAFEYARQHGVKLEMASDMFCGCGTVALEAKRDDIDFWGCDLNPVATLIAKAKSNDYQLGRLKRYERDIIEAFLSSEGVTYDYESANERIQYWFKEKQFQDLSRLKSAITSIVPSGSKYRDYFLCVFSNILKPTSVWLTKSIKPQTDPNKVPADVLSKFNAQCRFTLNAVTESNMSTSSVVKIETTDCLAERKESRKVDVIVSSPPYVTSYEYADLHQLSSLWLGYTDDYRDLRKGSIGSQHHNYNFEREAKRLNDTAMKIVFALREKDKRKARSVAKYFLDMQAAMNVAFESLNPGGLAFFVIGDTEYKDVRMENAKHLSESMMAAGFAKVSATKRKISRKILTPYRTASGKFTKDTTGRKIYSEEFIIVGEK